MLCSTESGSDERSVALRIDQRGQEGAEQLELATGGVFGVFHGASFDFGQHLVDVVDLARELAHSLFPRLQLGITVLKLVD